MTSMILARTAEEIEEQIDLSYERNYDGMTFSEGVRYTLDWVTGDPDDAPFEIEEEEDDGEEE